MYSFVGSLIIALVIGIWSSRTGSPRDDELEGLDVAIHGESAYEFGPVGGGGHYLPSGASKETVTA